MLVTIHFPYKSRGVLISAKGQLCGFPPDGTNPLGSNPLSFSLFSFPASGWSTVLLQGDEETADPIGTKADMAIQVSLSPVASPWSPGLLSETAAGSTLPCWPRSKMDTGFPEIWKQIKQAF